MFMQLAKIFNMVLGMSALALFLEGAVGGVEKKESFIIGGLAIFVVTFTYYTFSKVYYHKA